MIAFAGLICDVKMSSWPWTLRQNQFHLFVKRKVLTFCLMSWFSLSLFHLFVSNSDIYIYFLIQVCLANEIYKMLEGQKSASGKNQVCSLASYLYIACRQEDTSYLYIACRQEDKIRSIKSTKQFWFICIYVCYRLLVTVLFFLDSCHFYKRINSQTVGSWSLKPDNLLKWEPSTPEILWWVLLKSSAFGFLFVVLTFLAGNGESGSRDCA